MKKILLYAYDNRNLGDDLFVYIITKRYPDVQFIFWNSDKNNPLFDSIKNLKIINTDGFPLKQIAKVRPSLVARYKQYIDKSCEAIVYIGGSIFMQYDNWRQTLTWWDYESHNYPFFVLGSNFGPYYDEEYLAAHRQIFSQMKDICFRDKWSYMKFQELQNARMAPDILFGIQMPTEQRSMSVKGNVFFSVIDCEKKEEISNLDNAYSKRYYENIVQLVISAIQNGYGITLASFCKNQGDESAIEIIQNMISNKGIALKPSIIKYDGTNADALLQSIVDASLVVASRFHACILGFTSGKPVLPIIYSDKTSHVLQDLGFMGEIYDIRNGKLVDSDIEKYISELYMLKEVQMLQRESDIHFKKLDEFLQK